MENDNLWKILLGGALLCILASAFAEGLAAKAFAAPTPRATSSSSGSKPDNPQPAQRMASCVDERKNKSLALKQSAGHSAENETDAGVSQDAVLSSAQSHNDDVHEAADAQTRGKGILHSSTAHPPVDTSTETPHPRFASGRPAGMGQNANDDQPRTEPSGQVTETNTVHEALGEAALTASLTSAPAQGATGKAEVDPVSPTPAQGPSGTAEVDPDSVLDELLPPSLAPSTSSAPASHKAPEASQGVPLWLLGAAQRAGTGKRAGASARVPASLQEGLAELPAAEAALWASVIQADSTAQLLSKPQPPKSTAYSAMQRATRSVPSSTVVGSALQKQPVASGLSLMQHVLHSAAGTPLAERSSVLAADTAQRSAAAADELIAAALMHALQRTGVADAAGRPFVPAGTPLVECGRALAASLPAELLRDQRAHLLVPMLQVAAESNTDIQQLLLRNSKDVDALSVLLNSAVDAGCVSKLSPNAGLASGDTQPPQAMDDDAMLDDAFDF